jgi:hypothetical protein
MTADVYPLQVLLVTLAGWAIATNNTSSNT